MRIQFGLGLHNAFDYIKTSAQIDGKQDFTFGFSSVVILKGIKLRSWLRKAAVAENLYYNEYVFSRVK